MKQTLHYKKALLPSGWASDVVISADDCVITQVTPDVAKPSSDIEQVPGYAVAGMTNVHCHAFQHAFAGLSEYRTSDHDSFWTWRKLMFEFLEKLTPDDVYKIGKKLYSAMREAGYSIVGEFHYLLHQVDGTPYNNVNEMADALIRAAIDVGINICMLPVYYQRGGFDDSPLQGGQIRFGSSHDLFLEMLEKLKTDWSSHPQVQLGFALHSLRAVSVPASQKILADTENILPGCPVHIHVAEQTLEIDDCLAAHGRRSVELLLDSFDVNERWCLIHATHMTEDERRRVAASGAVVGVCPSTEANLGDGVFQTEEFLQDGGRLAIGSDSNISVDVCGELRLLEYAQRLTKRRRAVLCTDDQSCGTLLYDWTTRGGAQVTGFGSASLEVGGRSNFNVIDAVDPEAIPTSRIIDHRIFHATSRFSQ